MLWSCSSLLWGLSCFIERQREISHFVKERNSLAFHVCCEMTSICLPKKAAAEPTLYSWSSLINLKIYRLTCCTHNILDSTLDVSLVDSFFTCFSVVVVQWEQIDYTCLQFHQGGTREWFDHGQGRHETSLQSQLRYILSFPSNLDCVTVKGQFDLTCMYSWTAKIWNTVHSQLIDFFVLVAALGWKGVYKFAVRYLQHINLHCEVLKGLLFSGEIHLKCSHSPSWTIL